MTENQTQETDKAVPTNSTTDSTQKTSTERTAFVSLETEADRIKRNNLYLASAFIGFVWMLFHFTVVFFFTLTLGSPLLVGLFL